MNLQDKTVEMLLENKKLHESNIDDTSVTDQASNDNSNNNIEEANYIIDELKKKILHPNDYIFDISDNGSFIAITNKPTHDETFSHDVHIKIEEGFYKYYGSWKFGRNGYGYLGMTFRESDINVFINKLAEKLDKRFYEYETEPYKSDPHLIEIVAFLKKWHNWKFYKSAIPFFYYTVSKEELASYIEKAKKDAPQEFDKLVKQYNINFEKDYKFIKKYLNLNNS